MRPIFLFLIMFWLLSACTVSPTTASTTGAPTPGSLFTSTSGGDPRTSGYWLIWNSCAEGNQAETARANGGRAAGWILMDDLLADPGIYLGALQVESCIQGLYLLQRMNLQRVAMDRDPAYLLASQLLTAQLNLAAGSLSCQAVDQAVSDAHNLLFDLGFDGSQAFLGPPLAIPQVEQAGTLAELLGSYNSGSLCLP